MQTTRTFTVVDPFTVRWSYHQKRSQWEEMETGNVGAGFKFWSIKTNLVNIWQASLWEFRLIISFPWTPKFSLKQALFKSALFWTWFYNGVEEKVYIKTNKQKPLSVFSAAIVSDRNVNCSRQMCRRDKRCICSNCLLFSNSLFFCSALSIFMCVNFTF